MSLPFVLKKLTAQEDLTEQETKVAFDAIFSGTVAAGDIAAFLTALHDKGEVLSEILGAAKSMRQHMRTILAPPGTMDIVGTGGDKHNTLNISTATAFVVAACGVPVAKHGNKSVTSRSGASDVLQALGVRVEVPLPVLERALHEVGITFLFAPQHHPAMRFVAPVRKELGIRTIFNLLGPLCNPARVTRLLMGVYSVEAMGLAAESLLALETDRALVVHGQDGMDEITTTAPTDAISLRANALAPVILAPENLHLPKVGIKDLQGGDPAENAEAIRHLFNGKAGPYQDIVAFNAAAALMVAEKVDTLDQGYHLALTALKSGVARNKLEALIALTNEDADT